MTELNFHSTQPALLLSGSTDGLVSVHDTRIADEDEVTVQTFNHGASIHHAAFLGHRGEVFALSHDERFAFYDAAEETLGGDATQDFGDLREALGCQYVANVTPKTGSAGAVIGAGSQEYVFFFLLPTLFALSPFCQWFLELLLFQQLTNMLPGLIANNSFSFTK